MVATADEIAAIAAMEVDVNLENLTSVAALTATLDLIERLTLQATVRAQLRAAVVTLAAALIADAAAAEVSVLVEVA